MKAKIPFMETKMHIDLVQMKAKIHFMETKMHIENTAYRG